MLTRIIGEQRRKAREAIATKVAEELPRHVSQVLDKLLEVAASETVSGLRWIKKNPAKPSAAAMRLLAEKLEVIEATGVLGIDLEWLNSNYQRALFHYVRKYSAHRLRELARPRRRAALVCFLRQSYRDAVDQAVDMFDKLLTRTVAHAERELDQHLREQSAGPFAPRSCLCGPWASSSWMTRLRTQRFGSACSKRCPARNCRRKWSSCPIG